MSRHKNRKIEQFLNGKGKEWYEVDEDEPEEIELDFGFIRFDPWNLPFEGVAALQGRKHARLRNGQPELKWTGKRITSYQELQGKISTKVLIDAGNHVYLRITFSDRERGLPEETSLVIEEPNGWQGVMWRCKTDWVGDKERGWMPATVLIQHSRGNPKRPSSLSEWIIKGYWLCDKSVPEEVFQVSNDGVCAVDFPSLLELAVEKSVVPRPRR